MRRRWKSRDRAGDLDTAEQSRISFEAWPPKWRAQVLAQPPLIAPARQFTYPLKIAGEEDALGRGALQVLVQPAEGGTFLGTCALGFNSATMPTGVLACPDPDELCALAGGYAYIIDTADPEKPVHLSLRPVVEVLTLPAHGLLVFAGFHSLMAWGTGGIAWETARLSWEGIRLGEVKGGMLQGVGWDMRTDKDVAFSVDLRSGEHTGGCF